MSGNLLHDVLRSASWNCVSVCVRTRAVGVRTRKCVVGIQKERMIATVIRNGFSVRVSTPETKAHQVSRSVSESPSRGVEEWKKRHCCLNRSPRILIFRQPKRRECGDGESAACRVSHKAGVLIGSLPPIVNAGGAHARTAWPIHDANSISGVEITRRAG